MQAIQELYKIGRGPSSSHTLAPERACRLFTEVNGSFPFYKAELFGSLSYTGRGHCTDQIIKESLPGHCEVVFCNNWHEEFPNGFYLKAYDDKMNRIAKWTIFSLGGGTIQIKEYPVSYNKEVYVEKNFKEIKDVLKARNISLTDYIYGYEPNLKEYLITVLDAMLDCVGNGLHADGVLPGKLKMERAAAKLYKQSLDISVAERNELRLMAYAHAAGEENASSHTCVTAPTLGACGVMTALMYYCRNDLAVEKERLADALAVGGLFGNVIKQNATISGAVGGCQAEVGAAVSMAAAAYAYLMDLDTDQIEYAAEIGMEHHLGLTCDPVMGYVMIPCIERNAVGVLRAIDAAILAKYMSRVRQHLVSCDMVVETMNETGKRIPIELKETAEGGLAKEFEDAA